MARKSPDGSKRKGSDKAREHYEKQGKFSTKHIRIQSSMRTSTGPRATH